MSNDIWTTIEQILSIMVWIGVILGLLTLVNITCKAFHNVLALKQPFSWKKIAKGLGRMALFYISSICVSVAFSVLPYVNALIGQTFGIELVGGEILEQLSTLGVLGVCVNAIIAHGKKAMEGISVLGRVDEPIKEEEKIEQEREEEIE